MFKKSGCYLYGLLPYLKNFIQDAEIENDWDKTSTNSLDFMWPFNDNTFNYTDQSMTNNNSQK